MSLLTTIRGTDAEELRRRCGRLHGRLVPRLPVDDEAEVLSGCTCGTPSVQIEVAAGRETIELRLHELRQGVAGLLEPREEARQMPAHEHGRVACYATDLACRSAARVRPRQPPDHQLSLFHRPEPPPPVYPRLQSLRSDPPGVITMTDLGDHDGRNTHRTSRTAELQKCAGDRADVEPALARLV